MLAHHACVVAVSTSCPSCRQVDYNPAQLSESGTVTQAFPVHAYGDPHPRISELTYQGRVCSCTGAACSEACHYQPPSGWRLFSLSHLWRLLFGN